MLTIRLTSGGELLKDADIAEQHGSVFMLYAREASGNLVKTDTYRAASIEWVRLEDGTVVRCT